MKGAHLWKRILNEGIYCPVENFVDLDALQHLITRAPIIVDTRPSIDGEAIDVFSWRSLAFPFAETWIEGRTVAGMNTGSLVKTVRGGDGGWQAEIVSVSCHSKHMPIVVGIVKIDIDPQGNLIGEPETLIDKVAVLVDGQETAHALAYYAAGLACDTLVMLGCKNIGLKPNDNDPQQVRRAIKRHGGTPESYRYHTLVVRPAGSKPGTPGEDIGIMPRHVCRGHFAYYGPAAVSGHPKGVDNGMLFGRYAGKFYMPDCAKGDKKNGVVEKDYALA